MAARGQLDIHRAVRFDGAKQDAQGSRRPVRIPQDGKGETAAGPQDTPDFCQD